MARVAELEAAARAAGACAEGPASSECTLAAQPPASTGACVDTIPVAVPSARAGRASGNSSGPRKGLSPGFADASSLETPDLTSQLCHFWHPVHFLSKAKDGESFIGFGETWTLRAARDTLSGWRVYAAPSRGSPLGRELPTAAVDGLLAVWPGTVYGPPGLPEPGALAPPQGYTVHAEIVVEDVPVEHGLLVENLLDLAHAPFTHTGTFAKGWPVPSAVRFAAEAARAGGGWGDLGTWLAGGSRGSWHPYPIDMAFEPPAAPSHTSA